VSDELADLYQELILDHSRHPHNFRTMDDPSRAVEANNPLCGDALELYLRLEGGRIADVSFKGRGCAISMASASMLTDRVKGCSREEAGRLFDTMHGLLTGAHAPLEPAPDLGELEALAGVRRYPMRVKCATLSWHALKAALGEEEAHAITTE
jgi:nitrogen fixation NifU-like protein